MNKVFLVSANNYAWQIATHPATKEPYSGVIDPASNYATVMHEGTKWNIVPKPECESTPFPFTPPEEEPKPIDYMKAVRDMCK